MLDVMWHSMRDLRADQRGNFALEFCLALPILLLLMVGLVDLGRFGLQKSALLQGAREGAQYAIVAPTDTANINTTAQNATGLTGVTAVTEMYCECASAPGTKVSSCTCGGTDTVNKFVKVAVTRSFTSVLAPSSLTVGIGSFVGGWTPPTSVTADVTMIVP